VSDGFLSTTETVNVNIYDAAPVAVPNSYSFSGTNPQIAHPLNVIANDYDPEQPQFDNNLYFAQVNAPSLVSGGFAGAAPPAPPCPCSPCPPPAGQTYCGTCPSGSQSQYGAICYNNTANSDLIFVAANGFIGNLSFTYSISDGILTSALTTVTITIDNKAPIVISPSVTIPWNQTSVFFDLLSTATDPNNPPESLSVNVPQPPANSIQGTVVIGPGQPAGNTPNITYNTPTNPNYVTVVGDRYSFTDSFSYTVTNTYGLSTPGTVNVTVYNYAPIGVNEIFTLPEQYSSQPYYPLCVTGNDYDPDGDPIQVYSVEITSGDGGLQGNGYNASCLFYQPPVDYVGNTTLSYTLTDGQLQSAPVTVTVTLVSSPPTANAVTMYANKSTSYIWNVLQLSNAQSANGNPLTLVLSPENQYVKCQPLTVIGGNSINFTAIQDRSGWMTFNFSVTDGFQSSASIVFSVYIINLPPVAVSDYYTVYQNTQSLTYTENPMLNDTDPDGDSLEVVSVNWVGTTVAVAGTIQVLPGGGGVNFTKNAAFLSPPTLAFNYTISDMDLDNPMFSSVISYFDVIPPVTTTGSVTFIVNTYPTNGAVQIPIATIIAAADVKSVPSDQTPILVNVSCPSGAGYCLFPPNPSISGSNVVIGAAPQDNCQTNAFQYCVVASGDAEASACSFVYVSYQYCTSCAVPVDIGFVIECSSALPASGGGQTVNWQNIVYFVSSVINTMTLGPSAVNVAISIFSDQVETVLYLTDDLDAVNAAVSHLSSFSPPLGGLSSNTNAINALLAMNATLAAGPSTSKPINPPLRNYPNSPTSSLTSPATNPRAAVAKTIYYIGYGIPNEPCNCATCDQGLPWCEQVSSRGIWPGLNKQPSNENWGCSKTVNYLTGQTCTFNPTNNQFCYPCASPFPTAFQINNQLVSNGYAANWRIYSVGLGGPKENLCSFTEYGNWMIGFLDWNPSTMAFISALPFNSYTYTTNCFNCQGFCGYCQYYGMTSINGQCCYLTTVNGLNDLSSELANDNPPSYFTTITSQLCQNAPSSWGSFPLDTDWDGDSDTVGQFGYFAVIQDGCFPAGTNPNSIEGNNINAQTYPYPPLYVTIGG